MWNPVFNEYFADPFVWAVGKEYFAVGTGRDEIFPILHSRDLLHWKCLGDAMERLDPTLGDTYWAPEVAFRDGHYWMYYSVGFSDKNHHIRTAVSRDPQGPYRDRGTLVAPNDPPFAIDPHPFQDIDGRWFLFYARDFLDTDGGTRVGTALVADDLIRPDRVAGRPKVILRARHNWQRFQSRRRMYGDDYDWHTLEGPCVRRHRGRYYCFYSGGRWEDASYGVDYAVAKSVMGPYSDAGSESGPRVLRTTSGERLGPGHNSIFRGPHRRTYIAFHAWDPAQTGRRLFIERLHWTPKGPRAESMC